MEKIGTKINEIRKRKGLSQEALSDLAKINLRTLQRLEKNETLPHGDTLKRLCSALGINIEEVSDYGKNEDVRFIRGLYVSILIFLVVPLGNLIFPLMLWLTKRDKIMDLDAKGVEVLNFQILWTLIFYAIVIPYAFFDFRTIGDFRVPIYYFIVLMYLINIIYIMIGVVFSSKDKSTRYHYSTIQFIKQ